jgi:DNA-binding GntR family transcriptional regulator
MTLKRATLADQAYEELRARIISGKLPSGRRLIPYELAADLSISPTPVKEALSLLERDGLVESNPRRGTLVRRFHSGDVRYIFEARILLEVEALRRGCERGAVTPDFIAGISEIFDRQVAHAKRQSPVVFAEAVTLDQEFHVALIRLADNPLLTDWHRGVLGQTMTILTYSMETYDAKRAHHEHAAILAALKTGDAALMMAAMRSHLAASHDALLHRVPTLTPGGLNAA